MKNSIPSFLLTNESTEKIHPRPGRSHFPFLDRTLQHTAKSLKTLYAQGECATNNSLICRFHPVSKVLAFLFLIVIISLLNSVRMQMLMSIFIFLGCLLSLVPLVTIYRKVIILVFLFSFLIFAPAALNVITPGKPLLHLYSFQQPMQCWIYHIPKELFLTLQGCKVVTLLCLRVFNSVSLALLIAYTTSFPHLLKALKVLYIPNTLLMIIWLAYKFVFILCRTIDETYRALKSRLIGNLRDRTLREIIAGRIFFIYNKAQHNYEQTYAAMISRGYSGELVQNGRQYLHLRDYILLAVVATFGTLLIILQTLWTPLFL